MQSVGPGSVWGCCCKEEHPDGTGGVVSLQPREKEGMGDSKVLRNGHCPYSLARKMEPSRACSAGCSSAQRAAGEGGVTGSHISFPPPSLPHTGAANRRGAIGHQRLPPRGALLLRFLWRGGARGSGRDRSLLYSGGGVILRMGTRRWGGGCSFMALSHGS